MGDRFEEFGVVKDVVDGMLVVNIEPSSRCRACGVCADGQEKEMRLTVPAAGIYSRGDAVKIAIEGRKILLASFVVYMVPLLDMFIGYFLGFYLAAKSGNPDKAELVGALTGGVCFALSFYLSRWLNDRMERQGSHFIEVEKIRDSSH